MRSIKAVARREKASDAKARNVIAAQRSVDSFVNFAQKYGVGADNALTTAGYGFNPISRVRTTLEWVHRGSWIGGMAVDLVADDMTRGGITMLGDLKPESMEQIEEANVQLGVWNSINEAIKWSRLYGGSIAVMMIDGQNYSTPLRLDTIGRNAFKGLLVLDRWMVDPSLNDLVQDPGPALGLPKYYTIIADAPALPNLKVHHSRCIRLEGIKLPYYQRIQENLWGISILERLWDRMIAFDSATTGAAQLVYKSYIRTIKIKGLREVAAAGGDALAGLMAMMDLTRRYQGQEGITLLDSEDEFEGSDSGGRGFAGIADALIQFGQQISGALQIPLVRLFGQSPSGMNATGESDLRMYYDNIKKAQEKDLRVGVTRIYRAAAASEGIKVPNGFRIDFNSLWQLSDLEKADVAEKTARAIGDAEERGLISPKVAMEELRQSSRVTGIFTNISDKDIKAADDVAVPDAQQMLEQSAALGMVPGEDDEDEDEEADEPKGGKAGAAKKKKPAAAAAKKKPVTKKSAKDSAIAAAANMKRLHDLDVVIENPRGTIRHGANGTVRWQAVLPADYGYVRKTAGNDGDAVDVFLGPVHDSPVVYVVAQNDLSTGEFDEHKCMIGYGSMGDAVADYVGAYSDGQGWERIRVMKSMSMADFKGWLRQQPAEGV